jgi:hypothetical protein
MAAVAVRACVPEEETPSARRVNARTSAAFQEFGAKTGTPPTAPAAELLKRARPFRERLEIGNRALAAFADHAEVARCDGARTHWRGRPPVTLRP